MFKKRGFTLIELLAVVAILAILIMIAMASFNGKRDLAEDAKKKADLERLKIAFEDYYGDKNCYPPGGWFDAANDCGTNVLASWGVSGVPCDKKTGRPYTYETDGGGCQWFKVTAQMRAPAIPSNCASGCSIMSTYSVSSSNVSPYSIGELYYCSTAGSPGNCTRLMDPSTTACTPYFTDANCGGNASTRCATASTCYAL